MASVAEATNDTNETEYDDIQLERGVAITYRDLASGGDSPSYQAILNNVTRYVRHEPWPELSSNNKHGDIVDVLIDPKNQGRRAKSLALGAHYLRTTPTFIEDTIDEEVRYEIQSIIERIDDEWEDHDIDTDELMDSLLDDAVYKIESTQVPEDTLHSYHYAEIVFGFLKPFQGLEDASIYVEHDGHIVRNDAYHYAMTRAGFDPDQYAYEMRNPKQRHLRNRYKPQRPPLVDTKTMTAMFADAYSYQIMGLYAMVPLYQLFNLDTRRPMTFSKARLCLWNGISGTYADCPIDGPVTVGRRDGRLINPQRYYSPDEMCGFVHSYFKADLIQAKPQARPKRHKTPIADNDPWPWQHAA